jgi:glycosyltransferase involved in cell wall biosynthesis
MQAAALAPPGWSFVILGGCGQDLEQAEGLENLVCPGLVTEEEKSLWLDEATLGLNVVASGSGTNLKLAEYAAWGLPVMASLLGARGWNWQEGIQLIACDFNLQSLLQGLQGFETFIEQSKSEDESIRQQAELLSWRRLGAVFSQHIASCVTPA